MERNKHLSVYGWCLCVGCLYQISALQETCARFPCWLALFARSASDFGSDSGEVIAVNKYIQVQFLQLMNPKRKMEASQASVTNNWLELWKLLNAVPLPCQPETVANVVWNSSRGFRRSYSSNSEMRLDPDNGIRWGCCYQEACYSRAFRAGIFLVLHRNYYVTGRDGA